MAYTTEGLAKPGRQKKDEDKGNWWGTIEFLEMGMTHSLYTNNQELYMSLPRAGVKCTLIAGLKAKQTARETQTGTFVNQNYEMELIDLQGLPGSAGGAGPAPARRVV